MKTWQLQEAKARFSEVVRSAKRDGAQAVTVRGEVEVYVISKLEYERLQPSSGETLVQFMRKSPLYGIDLDFPRDRSLTRDEGSFE
mgnify:CR=1 FL=1